MELDRGTYPSYSILKGRSSDFLSTRTHLLICLGQGRRTPPVPQDRLWGRPSVEVPYRRRTRFGSFVGPSTPFPRPRGFTNEVRPDVGPLDLSGSWTWELTLPSLPGHSERTLVDLPPVLTLRLLWGSVGRVTKRKKESVYFYDSCH